MTHTTLLGSMQGMPLTIGSLIDFAARFHGDTEVVSRRLEGGIERTTWGAVSRRARQVARALDKMSLAPCARVATIAWNGWRHLELYYGISASGRVLHTINPRLTPDQMAWIVNHAEDTVVAFDLTFLPLIKAIQQACPNVRRFVALCEEKDLPPDHGVRDVVAYEHWIAEEAADYRWPSLDEQAASSLCYTSGTTGNPKGVLYSHRSTVLHAYASALPDAMGLSSRDVVLPVVPMFHVNAWGIPYSAALTGCKLVLPGAAMDGKSILELLEAEQVTFAAGVPTVWQMLLAHADATKATFSTLRRTIIGGSACPPAMVDAFRDRHGVEVLHAWGMTELSPLGSVCTLKSKHLSMSEDAQKALRLKQGRPVYGIDLRIVDDDGQEVAWDGRSWGHLQVKGPWVVREYFKAPDERLLDDGWFPTGDVATIDADGFMQITDRSKDLIKSGGEWISSIDLENIAMAHPAVAIAACIGVRHPKWDERPVVIVVRKPNADLTREKLLSFFAGKVSKWQIPDDVVFQDALPIGATGKVMKRQLRAALDEVNYRLPEAA